jgi:hypothetical protein
MDDGNNTPPSAIEGESLSYKFQRLRERIRAAVTSGELNGKLPGERELARRFKAKPKTLGKALTDLAAEGLLERSIGRGTYVRGSSPECGQSGGKWLIITDNGSQQSPIVQQLAALHAQTEVTGGAAGLRPSFISQFDAVIDVASNTPETFHRDMIVRGISVVVLGREPEAFKVHAALLDRAHAANSLARDIFLAGHRRLMVIEKAGSTVLSDAARTAAGRYAPHAAVESCTAGNIDAILDRINTAFLLDGVEAAASFREVAAQNPHLQRSSMAAIGVSSASPPCTGIYVTPADLAGAAAGLLRDGHMHRPTALWLTGSYIERGTIRVLPEGRFDARGEPTALSA